MLLSKVTGLPLAILPPAINLPFVALGMHQMGAAFAIRSAVGIAGLAGHWPSFHSRTSRRISC